MTKKQKMVLDLMISQAEREIELGCSDLECLALDGIYAMSTFGDSFFYALQDAGYSYKYVNDAAYAGEKGGYSSQVLVAIGQPFKDYFKEKAAEKIS